MTTQVDTNLLNAIMDAAVDAIVVADSNGVIIQINPAAETLFQHDSDALLGQKVNVLMPPDRAAAHDGYMAHHMETGEKRIIGLGREVSGQRKDGSVFPLHLSVGRAKVGDEIVFLGIMHDLSHRHATQAALERSQRLDAIGQMTGGISHDFNNLLTVVIGNLELLDMQIENERQRGLVKDALSAAELGADLTANLMTFSRKSNLKPELLDINVACKATLSLMKRTMGSGFTTKLQLEDNIDKIKVDVAQLQSAFLNICMNAKDAMPEGGEIRIASDCIEIDDQYIAQEVDVAQGRYVRISISDTGCGMTPATQARALEPFFTTKPAGHGTGLGLAMVYGFVRQSGGHITIYSEDGHGTTISLYFPAVKTDQAGQNPTPTTSDHNVETGQGHGQLVLVVEDNAAVRRLSVSRVMELGYTTLEAANAAQAWDMLSKHPDIALVFTDVVMPGEMDGFQLAQNVRAHYPAVKVLITSGYSEDFLSNGQDRNKGREVLRKPYRQEELARRLNALLAPD